MHGRKILGWDIPEKYLDDSCKSNAPELRAKVSTYQIYCLDDHRSLIEIEFQRINNVKKLNNLFFAIGPLKWFPVGIHVLRKIRKQRNLTIVGKNLLSNPLSNS